MLIPPPAWQEHVSKKAYVYLIRSLSTDTFYLGWTTDIENRLKNHNSGMNSYAKSKVPWQLIGYETFANVKQAKERERKFRHNPRMYALFKKRALVSFNKDSAVNGQLNKQVVG